jgi:hypothetical protein
MADTQLPLVVDNGTGVCSKSLLAVFSNAASVCEGWVRWIELPGTR